MEKPLLQGLPGSPISLAPPPHSSTKTGTLRNLHSASKNPLQLMVSHITGQQAMSSQYPRWALLDASPNSISRKE